MRSWAALLALAIAAFGSSSGGRAERACSVTCPKRPVCQEFWETPVIFAGRVTAMAVESKDDEYWIRVRFAITESFRGPDAKEIELVLNDSTCNPNFDVGQAWLVYATNREGQPGWTTSDCTRTRLLSEAAADLAYLRLPDAEKGTSRVIGRVVRERFRVDGGSVARDTQPVRGVPVVARGSLETFRTTTDADGRYEMPANPLDSYLISFEPPAGLYMQGQWRDRVSVPHHRGCAEADMYLRDDGRVSGRLLDARGKPVPNFPLALRFSPDARYGSLDQEVRTGADGRFAFRGVMPWRYTLAPSSLWQGEREPRALRSTPIDVATAQDVSIGDVRLGGDVRTAPLTIVVVRPDGSPAPGARVSIRQASGSLDLATDNGRIELTVIAGQSYEIFAHRSAWDRDGYVSELATEEISVQGPASVRVRLARSR